MTAAASVQATASISENWGFALLETDRYKLVVWEDAVAPVALFDLVEDPLEDHNQIDEPAQAAVVEELMEQHARPFFNTAPQRPHKSAFARAAD